MSCTGLIKVPWRGICSGCGQHTGLVYRGPGKELCGSCFEAELESLGRLVSAAREGRGHCPKIRRKEVRDDD